MITSITKEQEATLPELVERWVGHSSEPSTYEQIKAAVTAVYKFMGEEPPVVLIAKSPHSAVYTAAALKLASGNAASLYSTLDSTLGSTLNSTLYSTLDSTLRSTLYSTLGSTLDTASGSEDKAKEALSWAYGGSYIVCWWGFWAGYYDFAKSVGVKFDEEKYQAFTDFVRHVPHIVALKGIAIVCQKPTKIRWREIPRDSGWSVNLQDESNIPKNRQLHSEDGPVLEFEDDFKVHALWNIRFPEDLWKRVTDRTITAKEALGLENIEQRMAALRYLGAESVIEAAKSKLLDESKRGNKLYSLNGLTAETEYALRYQCPSTGREYVSFVPPEIGKEKDADLAMAWKHNMTKEMYQAMERES